MQKKYVSLSKLSTFLDNLKNMFAALGHKHTISDLTDYTVDSTLSYTSTNPVQNKIINNKFYTLQSELDTKADSSHEHTRITNGDGVVEVVTTNHTADGWAYFALAPSDSYGVSAAKPGADGKPIANLGSESNPWSNIYIAKSGDNYSETGYLYYNGTEYSIANDVLNCKTGVTAGTYKSVTVNAQGHVTAGTNPTTLAGYGITDAESKGAANTALSSAKSYADSGDATTLSSAKSYADTGLSGKMDSTNPVGSGTFSFGREDGSTVGQRSIVIGSNAIASGKDTVAMGRKAKSTGNYAVSIGYNNTVSGDNGISIGVNSTASSGNSIAIGSGNTASDWDAIALGRSCTASGGASTTLGMSTTASGYASLSTGYNTEAAGGAQTVLGSLNVVDDAPSGDSMKSKHLVIVGNGDLDAETITRSNAHTLDWDGNAWYAGTLKLGGTSYDDASEVALKTDIAAKTTVQFITWEEAD